MNDYKTTIDIDEIREYVSRARVVGFDYETAPETKYRDDPKAALHPKTSHIVGCSFCNKVGTGIYVPVRHLGYKNIEEFKFDSLLREFLTNTEQVKVAHNLPFESMFSYANGIVIQPPVYDTIAAAQLTLKNRFEFYSLRESGLKTLASTVLNEPLPTYEDVTNGRWFDELDPYDKETTRYGCADSDFALRLFQYFNQWFDKNLPMHRFICEQVESPTSIYVGMMKYNGVPVDMERLKGAKEKGECELKQIESDIKFLIGDVKIGKNASTDAFKKYLFETMKLPVLKKTDAGKPALDDEAVALLVKYSKQNNKPDIEKLCDLVLKYRKVGKILTTYIDGWIKYVDKETFCVYPELLQLATDTGRFACDRPNCFDKETEILTFNGWKRFYNLTPRDKVAQWNNGCIEFVKPTNVIKTKVNEQLIHFINEHINLLVTKDHRCLLRNRKTKKFIVKDAEHYYCDAHQINAGYYKFGNKELNSDLTRLLVATQADGSIRGTKIDFVFAKQRKVKRLKQILDSLNIDYKETTKKTYNRYNTRIIVNDCEKTQLIRTLLGKNKTFGYWLFEYSRKTIDVLLNELCYWDGLYTRKTGYFSSKKINCDVIQALLVLSNKRTNIREYWNKRPNSTINYQCDITNQNYSLTTNINKIYENYDDFVYCVTVPSSFIVVRRCGCVMVTGNCQNLPRYDNDPLGIRKNVKAPDGYKIIELDYSQAEIRIGAYYSNDQVLLDAYKNGVDVHAKTTSGVFGISIEEAQDKSAPHYKTRRSIAKATLFGTFYGQTGKGLKSNLFTEAGIDLTVEECNDFINKLLKAYHGFAIWQDEAKRYARYHSYVKTALGRQRPLPDIMSNNFRLRLGAERMAMNTPIQGLCADLLKLSMGRIVIALKDKPYIKPIFTVHDSLVFLVRDDKVNEATKLIKEKMETMPPLKNFIGLVADVAIGPNYGELKDEKV